MAAARKPTIRSPCRPISRWKARYVATCPARCCSCADSRRSPPPTGLYLLGPQAAERPRGQQGDEDHDEQHRHQGDAGPHHGDRWADRRLAGRRGAPVEPVRDPVEDAGRVAQGQRPAEAGQQGGTEPAPHEAVVAGDQTPGVGGGRPGETQQRDRDGDERDLPGVQPVGCAGEQPAGAPAVAGHQHHERERRERQDPRPRAGHRADRDHQQQLGGGEPAQDPVEAGQRPVGAAAGEVRSLGTAARRARPGEVDAARPGQQEHHDAQHDRRQGQRDQPPAEPADPGVGAAPGRV